MGRASLQAWSGRAEVWGKTHSELDVTDEDAVAAAMAEVEPQVVVNAAGYTSVNGAETNKQAANAVNVGGVVNIARACKQHGALLVSLGSDYVFDGTAGRAYIEQDATGPLSHYGWSQLGGERAALAEGGEVLHLRVQALYGLGRPTLLDRLLAMDDPQGDVRMVADRISQPSFADDVAQAAVGLIAAGARGIVHVANPGPVSWYDFALMVFEETGGPRPGRPRPPAARRESKPPRGPRCGPRHRSRAGRATSSSGQSRRSPSCVRHFRFPRKPCRASRTERIFRPSSRSHKLTSRAL